MARLVVGRGSDGRLCRLEGPSPLEVALKRQWNASKEDPLVNLFGTSVTYMSTNFDYRSTGLLSDWRVTTPPLDFSTQNLCCLHFLFQHLATKSRHINCRKYYLKCKIKSFNKCLDSDRAYPSGSYISVINYVSAI